MDVAHERARSGASEGLVIVAKDQNTGRGRHGNKWVGCSGNLYSSFILKPRVKLNDIGQFSFITAVALGQSVKPFLKRDIIFKNKWPNDCLLNDLKFAGILLETGLTLSGDLDYLVIGIGVNIANAPKGRNCIHNVAVEKIEASKFLKLLLENFNRILEIYRNEGFAKIRKIWLEDAKGIGQELTVRLADESFNGIFHGLDEQGALLLGLDNGSQKVIHSGEVFFRKEI